MQSMPQGTFEKSDLTRALVYAWPLTSFYASYFTSILLSQGATIVVLIAIGAVRMGQTHAGGGRRTVLSFARGAASLGKIPAAPRSPIFWKTWREIGWLFLWCTIGSMIALAADGYFYWLANINHGRYQGMAPYIFFIGRLYGVPEAVTLVLLLVTILAGTAIGTADQHRGLATFWQSRPIDARYYLLKRMGIGAMMAFVMMFAAGVTMTHILFWVQSSLLIRYADATQFIPNSWLIKGPTMVMVPKAALVAVVFLTSVAVSNFLRRRVLSMILVATLVIGYELFYGNGELQLSSLQNSMWRLDPKKFYLIPLETLLWLVVGSVIAALTIAAHEGRWRDRIEDWMVRTMSREEGVP